MTSLALSTGGSTAYCVSARADYFAEPDFGPALTNTSGACCLIEKHGGGYYFDGGDNIQIYG